MFLDIGLWHYSQNIEGHQFRQNKKYWCIYKTYTKKQYTSDTDISVQDNTLNIFHSDPYQYKNTICYEVCIYEKSKSILVVDWFGMLVTWKQLESLCKELIRGT